MFLAINVAFSHNEIYFHNMYSLLISYIKLNTLMNIQKCTNLSYQYSIIQSLQICCAFYTWYELCMNTCHLCWGEMENPQHKATCQRSYVRGEMSLSPH